MLMRNDSTERFKKRLWTSIMNYLRPILMHLTASSWIGSSGTIPSVCITHSTINCPQRNICYPIINNRRDKLLPSPEYGAVIHPFLFISFLVYCIYYGIINFFIYCRRRSGALGSFYL